MTVLAETRDVTGPADWTPYPRHSSRFFDTPARLARRMVEAAGITAGDVVLEPSAGYGPIVTAAAATGATVDAVESDPGRARILGQLGRTRGVQVYDFLQIPADPAYHAVVMTPPTQLSEDLRHVVHALGFLKQGGRLAAVVPAGIIDRTDVRGTAFRDLLADLGGTIERLPDETFEIRRATDASPAATATMATALVTVTLASPDALRAVSYFRDLIMQ